MGTAHTESPSRVLQSTFTWFKDALFPRVCVGCGNKRAWCCPACFASLTFRRTLTCPSCDAPSELGAFCTTCRGDHELAGLWSAQPYGNPIVRAMVRAIKYDGLTELIPTLGELMFAALRGFALPPTWHQVPRERWFLTPVPLYWRRARERGFNQAELLADYVGKRTQLQLGHVLERVRQTEPQSELKKDEARLKNVGGAFRLAAEANVVGNAYILVDDVYTSGATMEECARELIKAGAAEVWGLTGAKG